MTRRITTALDDGTPLLLRPLTLADERQLRDGIARLSDRSRYLRFFTGARHVPDAVVRRLCDADGHLNVSWGAIVGRGPLAQPVGAAHVLRAGESDEPELAFGVLDAWHARGLARMMIAAVLIDCAADGMRQVRADVLSENANAHALLAHLGGVRRALSDGVATYSVSVHTALARLAAAPRPAGLADVFRGTDRTVCAA